MSILSSNTNPLNVLSLHSHNSHICTKWDVQKCANQEHDQVVRPAFGLLPARLCTQFHVAIQSDARSGMYLVPYRSEASCFHFLHRNFFSWLSIAGLNARQKRCWWLMAHHATSESSREALKKIEIQEAGLALALALSRRRQATPIHFRLTSVCVNRLAGPLRSFIYHPCIHPASKTLIKT